nr:mast cell-expressed membrane protein 1 [Oryctolagus cuniculus]XP_008247383.1 mast cell-expressed membrane protein 1 [Oryctolagus cuniculus]XP_008247384.1 mast cell-expressed membrane protein 1 [Oryctolagus cuniculus]
MEAEKIYMNQKLKMQAALPRAKKQVAPASDEGDHDPDYENITLTRRNHDQPRSGDAPSATSQGAAQPRPPSDTAQVPQWLYKAIMSLYILLALAFLLCIILSALVLVKYSEMSEELKDLRTQLWNVSSWTQRCQEQQQTGWSNVERLLHEVANSIQGVANKVQAGTEKLKTEITQINKNIQKIFEKLEKKENP